MFKGIFLIAASATFLLRATTAYENDTSSSAEEYDIDTSTELLRTENRRVARQLNIPGQEYVVRGHSNNRQIIKIPSNVKVKVLPPQPPYQQNTPPQKRFRQQGAQQGHKTKHHQQSPGRPPKRDQYEDIEEEYYEDTDFPVGNKKKKPKRTKNGLMMKDVTPEEFYSESEDYEVFKKKPKKKPLKNEGYNRNQQKKYRKQLPQYYNSKYADTIPMPTHMIERPERRPEAPHYDEEVGYDFVRPTNRYKSQQERPSVASSSGYYDDSGYGYHDYTAASSITMKQIAPPNLAPDAEEQRKEKFSLNKKPYTAQNEHPASSSRYEQETYHHESDPSATYNRKSPSTRQIQSMFPQQYTTHNPFITRNLGLEDNERSYNQNVEYSTANHNHDNDNHQPDYHGTDDHDKQYHQQHHQQYHHEQQQHHEDQDQHQHHQHHDQQQYADHHENVHAASEQRPSLLPTGSSGIHIVNPPQFHSTRDQPGVLHQPSNGQRATIRDIIRQDCPESERLGYCASPPRYPTQQINNIVKRCSEILDAMYSPAPTEEEDDLSSFSSRSDSEADIQFVDGGNNVTNSALDEPSWSRWSRSSSDGSNTVCESALTQTEPGYAKEVSSGRWFVIMQTMDHIVQRIMTDTCERQGKPCAGLAGLKCSRTSNFHHGYKATRCVQRYTQQRLISWDPEQPQTCPKVRIFRFPTACLCHLSVD